MRAILTMVSGKWHVVFHESGCLPAGRAVDDHLDLLREMLDPGDIIIDGENTYYKDAMRRAEMLSSKGIRYMDVGVRRFIQAWRPGPTP
ncbi:MAG: NAD(P)-binding domain-containing protein [Syntrophobacteria bacterium]